MEKTAKLTKREIFEGIINVIETGEWELITAEDAVACLKGEIELLDRRATKARERAAAKREEGDELTARIFETLNTDNFMVINDIMNALVADYPEITPRKIATRLARLHTNNSIVKEYVTVPDAEGKNRKILGYKVVAE